MGSRAVRTVECRLAWALLCQQEEQGGQQRGENSGV